MTVVENGPGTREFAGKRALVTGGTRGIGAAVVRHLLDAGAEVLTTARSATSTAPEGAAFVAADVRTRAGAQALAAAAQDVLGGVDIVVHNAGGAQPYEGSSAIPDEEWQDALDLNYLASVRLGALLVPGMRERRSGRIVHIFSAAVLSPEATMFLHYAAAKENRAARLGRLDPAVRRLGGEIVDERRIAGSDDAEHTRLHPDAPTRQHPIVEHHPLNGSHLHQPAEQRLVQQSARRSGIRIRDGRTHHRPAVVEQQERHPGDIVERAHVPLPNGRRTPRATRGC
ncbi:SDR family NAD(P)-dependent oxidoreductase [Nonomuraea deserti]|uniref:SDR family NAD(P)-dependent oxidoreductase n=1 Tax=Nonomuraea deserti TaxID=1848322 RepID=UPI001C70948A|nr:SDR family NAD(P)-dependent oxidoreductase [Nonomuraea deserti]